MKNQIALEFIIIFSFVVSLFLFIFIVISNQRALLTNQQAFSQLQSTAQQIAQQINTAYEAGTGYSANVPIQSLFGISIYDINITRNGVVILSAKEAKQTIEAVAYSEAHSVLASNSMNTAFLDIQNSLGEICVDYQCPSPSNQTNGINMTTAVVHAAEFDGQSNSYIEASGQPGWSSAFTVSAWVETNVAPGAGKYYEIFNNNQVFLRISGDSGSTPDYSFGCFAKLSDGSVEPRASSGFVPLPHTWNMVTCTWAGNTLSIYVNGALRGTPSTRSGSLISTTVGPYIGISEQTNLGVNPWNGMISNMQLYNTALTPAQVMQLYQEGIAGQPLLPTSAWYPLNGNAADYSGNGGTGTISGPVLFPTVAQLTAKITNSAGAAVKGVLVGFVSTLGNFTSGGYFANYTDSNGMARAFLDQPLSVGGTAVVKATAFNGNLLSQKNLTSWWPLNTGQSNLTYDFANGITGNIMNASWSYPNYAAVFNGKNAWIEAYNSVPFNFTSGSFTFGAWIKTKSDAQDNEILAKGGSCSVGGYKLNTHGGYLRGSINNQGADPYYPVVSPQKVNDNRWHYVVYRVSNLGAPNTNLSLFIDGVPSNTYGPFSTVTWNTLVQDHFGIGYSDAVNTISCPFYFNGSIANVQVYNSILNDDQILSQYYAGLSGDPIPANLIAWWPLDGNAADYSGNGNQGSAFGNLGYSNPASPSASNASTLLVAGFNGINSYMNISGSSALDSGKQYSFVSWINTTSTSPEMIFSAWNNRITGYQLYVNGGMAETYSNGASDPTNAFVSNGRWHQVIAVFQGNERYLYLDGSLVQANSASDNYANTGNNQIGAQCATLMACTMYFTGNIANVQVYNTSLSAGQAGALYSEGLGGFPLSNATLAGWWPLEGNANDYSGGMSASAPVNVIYNKAGLVSPQLLNSLGEYGIIFNGKNSYLAAGNVLSYRSAGSEYPLSISAWVYPISYPPIYSTIVSDGRDSFASGYNLWILHNGQIEMLVNVTGSNGVGSTLAGGTVPTGRWSFVTATYNITGDTWYLYINAQLVASKPNPGPVTYLAGTSYDVPLTIGAMAWNRPTYFQFNGSIANVQVYNSSLSQQQIFQLYDRGMPPVASSSVPLDIIPAD